ncbi:hypothetical protein RB195_004805 [Necator americanus]|uniref:Uncharacterized protein n=1 Tax=Necator americanus TaxID=51031 RepID=A0ABR1BLP9_NECAM
MSYLQSVRPYQLRTIRVDMDSMERYVDLCCPKNEDDAASAPFTKGQPLLCQVFTAGVNYSCCPTNPCNQCGRSAAGAASEILR